MRTLSAGWVVTRAFGGVALDIRGLNALPASMRGWNFRDAPLARLVRTGAPVM